MEEHEENNDDGDGRYGCFGEDFLGACDLTEHLVSTLKLAWKISWMLLQERGRPADHGSAYLGLYIATDAVTYVEGLLVAAEGTDNEENGICKAGKIPSNVRER